MDASSLPFQKMCSVANWPIPIPARITPSTSRTPNASRRRRRSQGAIASRQKSTANGTQEEADVPRREGDIGRVDRLDGVQADHQHEGKDERPRQRAKPVSASHGVHDGRNDARSDRRVERDEQVYRLPARDVQPDPERQGCDHKQRQQDRPAHHRRAAHGEDHCGSDDRSRELQRMVAQTLDLVPALTRDQRRRDRHRDQQPGRSDPSFRNQQGRGDRAGRRQTAGDLEGLAHEGAPAGWTVNRSPETATRSASRRSSRRRYGPGGKG